MTRSREAVLAHVDTVERIAHASGVDCEMVVPLSTAPGPAIIRVAQDDGCNLIVTGAHGPNDTNRPFAGSVAQFVLADAEIPALLLRDPRDIAPPDFPAVPHTAR